MTQFDKVILYGSLYLLEKISSSYGYKNYAYINKLNDYISEIRLHGYEFYYTRDFDSRSSNTYYLKLYYKDEIKYNALVKITKTYLERLLTN